MADEIQQGLRTAFATVSKNDWATENAHPGILIEELIEPSASDRSSITTPDELKCHTVWGELFFCQWVWVSHMNPDLEQLTANGEALNQGHVDFGMPEYVTSGCCARLLCFVVLYFSLNSFHSVLTCTQTFPRHPETLTKVSCRPQPLPD